MLEQFARRLYARHRAGFVPVFVAIQISASVFVALAFLFVAASYYHPSLGEFAVTAAVTSAFTALGVGYSIARQRDQLAAMVRWQAGECMCSEDVVAAWDAATNFTMRSFRRDSLTTNAIAALPSIAVYAWVLELDIAALPVLLAAGVVAAMYGTVLTYSMAELLTRPAVEDIAARLPEDFRFTRNGLPIRKRLMISIPAFTAFAGLIVAALVAGDEGTGAFALGTLVAVGAALGVSSELSALLSSAVTDPIGRLREALARVRDGDYEVRVPVVTSDELGEVANAFNEMARGLAEREQIRSAFGTYLDKDVADLVLSGSFPEDGVEVTVTIMFCDVPGFTPFAERSSPREVVAALNALFELLVPIVQRHGGHVDKFMGDGFLAVFGAPEGYADHADRALAAGLDMLAATASDPDGLGISVGLNTGAVVAGSIGGAGRLNFSVIGDAVNVAARVESATRGVDDDLLLTCSTRDALVAPVPLASRGAIALKGKSAPVELFAPATAVRDGAAHAAAADGVPSLGRR